MIAFARKPFWRVCFACGEWFSSTRKEGCYCCVCHSENLQRPRRTGRFCEVCGKPFIPKEGANSGKCCSRECGFEYQRQWREETRANHPHTKVSVIACEVCETLFVWHGKGRPASTCSIECTREKVNRKERVHGVVVCECGRVEVFEKWYRGSDKCARCNKREQKKKWLKTKAGKESTRRWNHSETGKAIRKSAKKHYDHVRRMATPGKVDRIELSDIMERDGGRCQLCRCKVKMPTMKWSKTMATLDHIIPLSRGGTHTMDNVQLACAQCNSVKGAKRKGQLRLIG